MTNKIIWVKAVDVLRDRGWNRYTAENGEDGCVCVGGAIAVALGYEPWEMYEADPEIEEALHRFADFVGEPRGGSLFPLTPATRVYTWNDNKAKSKSHVIETLKALEELDEMEKANG